MIDAPDNLVLVQLRDMRREMVGALEAVATTMQATEAVDVRLEPFAEELTRLRVEISGLRGEHRSAFLKLESDLVHLEGQNISRHGETLHALAAIHDLQGRTTAVELDLGRPQRT